MNKLKLSLVTGMLVVFGGLAASEAQAQIFVRPPLVGPRVVARAVVPAPIVRPVVRAPVVTAYRATVPTYVAPVRYGYPTYSTYRPVVAVPAPVYTAPVVVTTRVRPAVIPGQPVRNAIRLSIP